jgi:hypothetical protein
LTQKADAGQLFAFCATSIFQGMVFLFNAETFFMKKINLAVSVTTVGLVAFVVLCSLSLSFVFPQLYLFGLTGSLIWMVITILKHGEPSSHTFDDRFYEDAALGPGSRHD